MYEELNKEIKAWANKTKTDLKAGAPVRTGRLKKSIKANIRKQDGVTNRIGFGFERYGVFLEYGTGRGYERGRKLPSRAENRKNVKTKMRKPVPWFSGVLEQNIEELADITAGYFAGLNQQAFVNNINLKNKG